MKKHTTVLSLLSGLLLLTGCTEEPIFITSFVESGDTDNIDVETIYDGILHMMENMEQNAEYSGYVDFNDAEEAVNRVRHNYPEYFWIDSYNITSSERHSEISVECLNGLTSERLSGMLGELEAAAERIISDMPSNLDDYGKILYVHDYIVDNTVYDHAAAANSVNGIWGTAYGCLVEGSAICQGYSEAFQYIMNRLNIPCGTVTGMAWSSSPYSQGGDSEEPIGHAWNYVQVNGRYYWIDVTWDDPDEGQTAGSSVMHTYCLIDDGRMMRTRTLSERRDDIPKCYSMDDNYFVRNKAYITLYSREAAGEAIAAAADKCEVELMFADENVYNEAIDNLFNKGDLWNMEEYADIGQTVNYTTDETMYVLKIDY